MKRVAIYLILVFILIAQEIFAIEGMEVNITYPLTPPSEVFSEIEEWKYVRTPSHIFSPIFRFSGEANREFIYNVGLNTGFSYLNTSYTLHAERKALSIYDSTKTDCIKTSLHYKNDSLSLGYRNSSWFDLRKEVFSFTSYFTTESKNYIGEISTNLSQFEKINNYSLSSSIHKLYGYENMFTLGLAYFRSRYLMDREKMLQVEISNRFAYEDYLFAIPGMKAEFLSQTLFTPFIHTIYLINKNISFKAEVYGNLFETNLKNPYNLQYTTFPESLKAPVNLVKGVLEIDVVADTSFQIKTNICARKTKYPIVAVEKGTRFLSYENMDTTITFASLLFALKIAKEILTLNSSLSLGYAPFYEDNIPYFPGYQLTMDIGLHPLKGISLVNRVQYVGQVYDSNGREIEPYYIFSPSFGLRIMKNAFLDVGALNVTDYKERFIGDIYFPGRVIKSGIKIFF